MKSAGWAKALVVLGLFVFVFGLYELANALLEAASISADLCR